jgi:hypothetical protein
MNFPFSVKNVHIPLLSIVVDFLYEIFFVIRWCSANPRKISFPCLPVISWFDMLSLTENHNWTIILNSPNKLDAVPKRLVSTNGMRVLWRALLLFTDESLDKCSVSRCCHSILWLSFVFANCTHFVSFIVTITNDSVVFPSNSMIVVSCEYFPFSFGVWLFDSSFEN